MFQIISVAREKSSLSELFGMADGQAGRFSFDSSIQKYILYIFIGIAVLLLIRKAVKALRAVSEKEEVTDSLYRLRKLSTRIEHLKEIVSKKKSFTYQFFDRKEKRDDTWRKGKFLSMDRGENLIVALYAAVGKPEEHINKILEIKYPDGKNNGNLKSPILKYMGSKKTGKNIVVRMYEIKLPLLVKLEPKREDIRFKVSDDYPIRAYLCEDELFIPITANCIDFSIGGMFVELEDPKAGCLEYLMKKDKIIAMNDLDEEQTAKLTSFKILSQPELGFKEAREAKKKAEKDLGEYTDSIKMTTDFISSLKKGDIIKLFFILSEFSRFEEDEEELLSPENRTIMCDATINNKIIGYKSGKNQFALNFSEIDGITREIIYRYGLRTGEDSNQK